MKKIWLHKATSFKAAERFDRNYYLSMSKKERLETMQFLRDVYNKIKKGMRNASGARLRRVVTIIQ